MSGETETNVSGWTVDTLHTHLSRLLEERDRRYQERFEASEKAVTAAFEASKEAAHKVETSAEARFGLLNELRSGVATSAELEALEKRLDELKNDFTAARAHMQGGAAKLRGIYAALAGAVGLISIFVFIANGKFG